LGENRVNILGVAIDPVQIDDVLEIIQEIIHSDRRAIITHVHVMGLNLAYENTWFRDFLNQSNLVYCDGMGVLFAAKVLGSPLPQRLTLADWMDRLAALCEKEGYSLFLLGNPQGSPQRAAAHLTQQFPGLGICGTQHGYFNKTLLHPENEAVVNLINAAKPDILLVGFGMPAQEKWLLENRDRLEAKVAITVGALFEYIGGDLPRGPKWMTQNYLEWFFRLIHDPRRYARRYFYDNPVFIYRLLKQKLFGLPKWSDA
jgi:N-acetylglucosaminyldiphosphoundecaprenol N-acetyl-beta-D-mannosaminyltransferase